MIPAVWPIPRVGIIGVGNMGGAMAARLLSQGYLVAVHDVDAQREAQAVLQLRDRDQAVQQPAAVGALFGVEHACLAHDFRPADLRRFGYSRDKRSDCVQVVIALMVTPEGFPLAYEVLPGNTADKTTLQDFLAKIEKQYGKAERIWVMDRGIPTEDSLAKIAEAHRGRDTEAARDWQQARPRVRVKLLPQEGETYVLVQSQDRIAKERAMRRRRLRTYLNRLA